MLVKNNFMLILIIVAVACGSTLASYIYLPSFPILTEIFNTSKTQIQLTLTVFMLSFSVFQLLYGPLSDRYGRKIFMLLGTLLCLLGTLVCILTHHLLFFFIGRFLQGVGAAAGMSLSRTIARDLFNGDELSKVFSLMGILFALSFALTPILGGYLQTFFGWQSNFVFVAFYMLLMLVLLYFFTPETNRLKSPEAIQLATLRKNVATLFSSKIFLGFALSYGLTWSGMVAYFSLSPFLFQDKLKMSAIAYGHLAIIITAGLIVSSLVNSAWVTKLGSRKMMDIGLYAMLVSSIVMLGIGAFGILKVSVVMIPMFFFTIGMGIVSANTGAGAMSPFGHIAGIAGAFYGGLQFFVTFLVSWIVAHLAVNSQQSLAVILVCLSLGSMFFYYGVALKEKKEQNQ